MCACVHVSVRTVTTQLLFVFFIGASGEAAMSLIIQNQKQKSASGFTPRAASLPDWVTVCERKRVGYVGCVCCVRGGGAREGEEFKQDLSRSDPDSSPPALRPSSSLPLVSHQAL